MPRHSKLGLRLMAFCALSGLLLCSVQGQVVINEFTFQPLDGQDYVELYNAGTTTVDLSNWTIGSRDVYALNVTLNGPSYVVSPGTTFAPGDYFVLGLAGVPDVDQVVSGTGVSGRLWEDRNETIEVLDAAGTVRDAFYTEVNKEFTTTPPPSFGLPPEVSSLIGGGWYDNIEFSGAAPGASMSRFFDGVTTNVNGADFGVRGRTPGTSNNAVPVVSSFQPQNVNGLAVDAEVPQLRAGSYEGARAIDPTIVSVYNPNPISAPPTGNRAITVIDPAGGGNVAISNELLSTSRNGSARFSILAYLQTTPTADLSGVSDFTGYGIGSPSPLFNRMDPGGLFAGEQIGTFNGVAWYLHRDEDNVRLFLLNGIADGPVDLLGAFGPPGTNQILADIDLRASGLPADWYELSIEVDAAGNITGFFGGTGQTYLGSLIHGTSLEGSFWAGWTEVGGFPGSQASQVRPATFVGRSGIDGDFNDDGVWNCADINALIAEIAGGANGPSFDLTGDGLVDRTDRDAWLSQAGGINLPSGSPYLIGDANLDGVVDGSDFGLWNSSKFTAVAAWCQGDFNADGVVDGSDFGLWNSNKFTSSDRWNAVPEPSLGLLLVLAAVAGRSLSRKAP